MKISPLRIALMAFICGASALQADILILKNGNRVEGSILTESATAVRMKYRLTPKIWDEKDFPMTDIQQVIKQRPEEVEIIELRKLTDTPDLMTADRYEQIIQDRLRPFVNKYAGTPEAKEADTIIATLQTEKNKVSSGELKVEGRWLSATAAKGEEFNIQAFQILKEMRDSMAKNDWVGALRVYDKFTKTRPGYVASTHYPAALTEALVCLKKWEAVLSKMALEQPALTKQRAEGLKKLTDEEGDRTKAAIKEEEGKWRAQVDAYRRAQVRWVEPYKYDLNSILTAQKSIVAERTRIEAMNLNDMKERNEAFSAVYRKIGEGDYTGGAAAFERVSALGNSNEYRDVVADLKGRLLKLYGDLVRKQQTSTASATSGSSAMAGDTSSSVDDRVARILAEANGQAAPAPAPAAGTPIAAPVTPTPVAAPVPRPVIQQPVAPIAPPPVAFVPPAEESSFQTYIIVGMGALLALLVVMLLQKKKA